MRFLVHLGANVDTRDDYLSTPLHFLAYTRDAVDEILLLVDAGAGKNAKNHESHTPLHMALADATRAATALIEVWVPRPRPGTMTAERR